MQAEIIRGKVGNESYHLVEPLDAHNIEFRRVMERQIRSFYQPHDFLENQNPRETMGKMGRIRSS